MNKIKILIFAMVVGVSVSCEPDFLNPDPGPNAAISGENFPADNDDLNLLLNSIYDELKGVNGLEFTDTSLNHGIQREFYITEMLSDNTRSKSGEAGEASQSDFFQILSTNGFVADNYRSMYSIINRDNLTLENLDVAIDEQRAQIESEARFMRAYAYFNLVRLYGDIPLVLETLNPNDLEIQFTRIASSQVYDVIIEDFEFAIDNLNESTNRYRANIPAAQGLLAKVYLTLGTNYTEAQSLLESIINSEVYSLEPNFKDVFFTEANSETIFSVGYLNDNSQNSQDFSAEMLNSVGRSSGQNYLTNDMIEVMTAFGGNRNEFSFRVDPAQISQTQVIKYLPNGDEDLGIAPTGTNPRLAGNDWIVLRYADVLLMHAEAILAGGQSTTSTNAIASVTLVRERAGLVDPLVEVTNENLLLERRVELAFENQRWFDLQRFGVAQEVLSAFSASIGGAFTATDLLLPIPQFEINLSNGAMEQNPGY